jgi:hypothetical protein
VSDRSVIQVVSVQRTSALLMNESTRSSSRFVPLCRQDDSTVPVGKLPRCSLPSRTDFISAFASDTHSCLADVNGTFCGGFDRAWDSAWSRGPQAVRTRNADSGMGRRDEHSRGSKGIFRPEQDHSLCCCAALDSEASYRRKAHLSIAMSTRTPRLWLTDIC